MAVTFSAVGTAGASSGDQNAVDVPVAGTPAAGNLLIIHVLNQREENTWATPSGWTLIGSQVRGMAAFYKIAAGGETTVTVTKTGTTGKCLGRMFLFTSDASGTLSIDVSNSDTDLIVPTMTPTKIGTMLVWLAGRADNSGDFSAYAITTDDPGSWTERYEDDAAGQCTIAGATSAIRTATTATGNMTATGSGGNQAGIIIAIGEVVNVTASPSALPLTSALPAIGITTSSIFSVSAISLTATLPTPTFSARNFLAWNNPDKNSETFINSTKHAAVAVNPDKNSGSFVNLDKS